MLLRGRLAGCEDELTSQVPNVSRSSFQAVQLALEPARVSACVTRGSHALGNAPPQVTLLFSQPPWSPFHRSGSPFSIASPQYRRVDDVSLNSPTLRAP